MNNKSFAKAGNLISYIAMGLGALLLQAILETLPSKAGAAVMIVYLLMALISSGLTRNQEIQWQVQAKLVLALEISAVIVIGMELRSTQAYFMLLMQPLFMAVLYLDTGILRYMLLLVAVQHIILLVCGFPWMSGRPELAECIFFYLVIISYYVAMKHMIQLLLFRERQSREQELSLDDLLKVLSVKCEEAQNATKSKSEFLSHMSHEIRTPINSILGMNEMILRESTEEPVLEYATDVENAGTTLLALINDILDFSKIESGKLEIIPVEYSVRTMVHDLVNMIEPRARKKGLTLHVEINPNMPNGLVGDDVRVRQIVTNILTNAVKYTEKGSVYLSVDYRRAETGLLLLIKVRDTGIGIRSENLDAIFQSFQRVDEERNRGVEGTGLGLSITSSLLELMDGELRVESEYGKGSIFYITIPQKICSGETVGDFAEELKHDMQKREKYAASFVAPDAKILVVDDNGMNINVIVQLLKKTRVHLDTALSGRECIEQVQHKQYDLILMDHMMPEMDGVETLSKLKAEMPHFATPVIALTANAVSGAKDQYLSYGFQDYLSKPVRGSALEEKLREWLPKEKLLEEGDGTERSADAATMAEPAEDSGKSDYPEEINFDAALEFSANGKEGVDWNIDAFRENVPEVAKALYASYTAEDWNNYGIHVHGLKSNLACIGAEKLSARAKELELHAKEGDAAFVKEHHASFYADFEALLGNLSGDKEQESERELLEHIIEMADDFDAVGVQEMIGQLNKQKHHPDMQGGVVLDRLTEAGEKLDFETIKKLANLILHSQSDPT